MLKKVTSSPNLFERMVCMLKNAQQDETKSCEFEVYKLHITKVIKAKVFTHQLQRV